MSRKSLQVGARSPDVVIIGGGIIGAATAYFLVCDTGFRGRIVVLEQDPSYAHAATALSASRCGRNRRLACRRDEPPL